MPKLDPRSDQESGPQQGGEEDVGRAVVAGVCEECGHGWLLVVGEGDLGEPPPVACRSGRGDRCDSGPPGEVCFVLGVCVLGVCV